MGPSPETTVVFSAVLRPHRSASRRAVRWLGGIVLAVSLVPATAMLAAGAWPVVPFLGVEIALLYALLAWNLKAGNECEAINLTRRALTVRRVDPWGRAIDVSFPPNWLQVNIDAAGGPDNRLELRVHGRSLTIARFLQPHERLALAATLRRELSRLTRTPQPA